MLYCKASYFMTFRLGSSALRNLTLKAHRLAWHVWRAKCSNSIQLSFNARYTQHQYRQPRRSVSVVTRYTLRVLLSCWMFSDSQEIARCIDVGWELARVQWRTQAMSVCFFLLSTRCPKNVTILACYNCDIHQPILTILRGMLLNKLNTRRVFYFSTSHN